MTDHKARKLTTKQELAAYLRDALTGGDGYLLDCLLQERVFGDEIKPYVVKLFEVARTFPSNAWQVGFSSPEAKAELWKMVAELEGNED